MAAFARFLGCGWSGAVLMCALASAVPATAAEMPQGPAIPAVMAGQEIKDLLQHIENQIDDGHTTRPENDNALVTWHYVLEQTAPGTPATQRMLADFATRLRSRAVEEEAGGRLVVSIDMEVFADLATELLRRVGAVAPDPASVVAEARVAPAVTIEPPVSRALRAAGSADPAPEPSAADIRPASIPLAAVPSTPEAAQPPPHRIDVPVTIHPADPAAVLALKRGDAMLAIKDVSAARKLYEYAANSGNADAAAALGRTYDPVFVNRLGTLGLRPDSAAAAIWYRRAVALGDAGAETLLRNLTAQAAR